VDFLGATFDDAFELGPIWVGVIRVKNFLPIATFISLVITTTTIALPLSTPDTKCRRSSISYCTYVCAVKFMLLMLFPCVPLTFHRHMLRVFLSSRNLSTHQTLLPALTMHGHPHIYFYYRIPRVQYHYSYTPSHQPKSCSVLSWITYCRI
jgi:hypothetical protein